MKIMNFSTDGRRKQKQDKTSGDILFLGRMVNPGKI